MPTPADRIVWELERLPVAERVGTFVQVMQRLGMTTRPRPGALSRGGIGWLATGAVVLGLATGLLVWRNAAAWARLDLATEPADARVFIDGYAVHDPSRTSITRKRGTHTLSVTMPGYTPSDQNIVLDADRTLRLRVKLKPSADTGFQITSEPAGVPVWLDGEPLRGDSGPARTDFRAGGIAPGRHLLELKHNEGSFPLWRQAIEIEPAKITEVHAAMLPSPPRLHGCTHYLPSGKE